MPPRFRLRMPLALLLGAVCAVGVLMAAAYDLSPAPQLFATRECRVFGESARIFGLADGSVITPDSGGCLANECADERISTHRFLWPDQQFVERTRRRC